MNDTCLSELTLDDGHLAVGALGEEANSGATLLQVVVVTRLRPAHCKLKKVI